MLKGIDPLLNADLLYILRAMGHGDDIVIADANFPAEANAKKLVRMEAASATQMARAILSVMPIDDFVDDAALRIEVVGAPDEEPPVCQEFAAMLQAEGAALGKIDRFAFYERTKRAFAVIATGEQRLYGCLLLKKGVIRPA